jgi:sialidase-1
MLDKKLDAAHGIVCDMPHDRLGYFGWPSVARRDDGVLVVAASGLRYDHVCPWGKTVLFTSADEGRTWSIPRILNDTPLDDRDAGIISLGGSKLLVSWFTSDTRRHVDYAVKNFPLDREEQARWEAVLAAWTDPMVARWSGSWVRTSVDGESWSDFHRAPVNTPHGPIRLAGGQLLYFGKEWDMPDIKVRGDILAATSDDEGRTWTLLGRVPIPGDTVPDNFHEPHVVELPSGKLIGMIRLNDCDNPAYIHFSLFQTESEDGGRTWTPARHLGVYGSPPHLIRHSSGAIVCVYSYRKPPLGHRAIISWDDGKTWDGEWILRDDAPPRDHGYPCSVELPDRSIFTVYYQRASHEYKNCGVLWTRWPLPPRP